MDFLKLIAIYRKHLQLLRLDYKVTSTIKWAPNMHAITSFLKQYPFAMLLAVQLISVLFYGMMSDSQLSHLIFNGLGMAVPILAVWVVYRTPAINWVAFTLMVFAIGASSLTNFANQTQLLVWAQSFESLLYFYAAISLIMYMFADNVVTRDELYAAAAAFTLLVWGFALAYSICQHIYPGSISAATHPEAARTWMELLFMSFSIQSGTGIGDIIPVSNVARALSAIQMFSALMYITIVVSHLVGLAATAKFK